MATCTQCGMQLSDSDQTCTQCGHPVIPAEATAEVAASIDLPFPALPLAPARRWKPLTVLIAALSIVAIAGLAFGAYLLFGLSPKERFLLAESRYITDRLKEFGEPNSGALSLQKALGEDATSSQLTITGNFETSDPSFPANIQRLIERSRLVVNSKSDPKAGKSSSELQLHVQDSELISAEFYQANDLVGLRVPVLYDRFIYLENKNLREVFRKNGIPYEGPDRFVTSRDYEALFKQNAEELLAILLDYSKAALDAIHEEDFTLEKNVQVQSPDGSVKVDRLTLNLSEERLKEILRSLAQRLQNDERALDLYAGKVSEVARFMLNNGSLSNSQITEAKRWLDRAYVKEEIRKGATEFDKELSKVHMPGGLQIAIMLDGSRVVQHDVKFAVGFDKNDAVRLELKLEDWITKDDSTQRLARLLVAPEKDQSDLTVELKSRSTPVSKTETKLTDTLSFQFRDKGREEVQVQIDLDGSRVKEAEKGKDRFSGDFTVNLGKDSPGELKGKLSSLYSNNPKSRFEQTNDFALTFKPNNRSASDFKVTLRTDLAVDMEANVQFPELTDATAFNVSKASRSDLQRLAQEIIGAGQRFISKNARLLQ